jgi:hypothetical protein
VRGERRKERGKYGCDITWELNSVEGNCGAEGWEGARFKGKKYHHETSSGVSGPSIFIKHQFAQVS